MQSCILAKSSALSAALRRVLNGFHSQKSQAKVDSVLLRLYEPILFRCLSASNNAVRCNAFSLLFDAFPIQVLYSAPESEALILQQSTVRDPLSDSVVQAGPCMVFMQILVAHG